MSLPRFLDALFDQGHVSAPHGGVTISPDDRKTAEGVLLQAEAAWRSEFPGEAPCWDPASGAWAAEMFYRACWFVVQRDAGERALRAALGTPCPAAPESSRHYSVDLVFRFLPDLYKLAEGVSRDDPLLPLLQAWALEWPLSSVGMSCAVEASPEPLLPHQGLVLLYVDRAVARRDLGRLNHPVVAEAARAALGAHAALAPEVWAAVNAVGNSA